MSQLEGLHAMGATKVGEGRVRAPSSAAQHPPRTAVRVVCCENSRLGGEGEGQPPRLPSVPRAQHRNPVGYEIDTGLRFFSCVGYGWP